MGSGFSTSISSDQRATAEVSLVNKGTSYLRFSDLILPAAAAARLNGDCGDEEEIIDCNVSFVEAQFDDKGNLRLLFSVDDESTNSTGNYTVA